MTAWPRYAFASSLLGTKGDETFSFLDTDRGVLPTPYPSDSVHVGTASFTSPFGDLDRNPWAGSDEPGLR
jgi:hypothetical protein